MQLSFFMHTEVSSNSKGEANELFLMFENVPILKVFFCVLSMDEILLADVFLYLSLVHLFLFNVRFTKPELHRLAISNFHQDSRTSLLMMQKNTKMKKPWRELKKTKRTSLGLRISSLPMMARAANNHAIPNKIIIPARLIMGRINVFKSTGFFSRDSFRCFCLTNITVTMMNITELTRMTANIGPKKASQNTMGLLRKQLQKKKLRCEGVAKKKLRCEGVA